MANDNERDLEIILKKSRLPVKTLNKCLRLLSHETTNQFECWLKSRLLLSQRVYHKKLNHDIYKPLIVELKKQLNAILEHSRQHGPDSSRNAFPPVFPGIPPDSLTFLIIGRIPVLFYQGKPE